MPVDRAKLKEEVSKLSPEHREALAEELGLQRDASKADILKALEGIDARVKKLETPPEKKNEPGVFDSVFRLFGG